MLFDGDRLEKISRDGSGSGIKFQLSSIFLNVSIPLEWNTATVQVP